jgi:hypothetical protein
MHLVPREGNQSRVCGKVRKNARSQRWRPVGFGAVVGLGEYFFLGIRALFFFHVSAGTVPE